MEEKKMTRNIKRAVFSFFMLLLILPGLQFKFGIIKFKPLGSDYPFTARPAFNWDKWASGDYQKNYEKYVNDHIGMREFFLRSYNQAYYSLFGILRARDVIMGKNYCLFEKNYIDDYTGANFKGKKVIDEQLRKACFLQDTLAKRNTKLIFFFAPGKASFFPENIPQGYLDTAKSETNYKYYIKRCRELGLNYFDMNAYFMSIKGKTPYPVYTNAGIHWTYYGMTLAVDSLLHYLGHLQNAPLPKMVIDSIEVTHEDRETDADIAKGLNLLFPLPHPDFAYPKFHFDEVPGMKKPSVLVIGDSFWWNIFGPGMTKSMFNGSSFWFYNEIAYYDDLRPDIELDTANLQKLAADYDFIILLSTEGNLYRFTYDFVERYYDIYIGKGDAVTEHNKREQQIINEEAVIRGNAKWLEFVRGKAVKANVPVDTMIRRDAIYMVNTQNHR